VIFGGWVEKLGWLPPHQPTLAQQEQLPPAAPSADQWCERILRETALPACGKWKATISEPFKKPDERDIGKRARGEKIPDLAADITMRATEPDLLDPPIEVIWRGPQNGEIALAGFVDPKRMKAEGDMRPEPVIVECYAFPRSAATGAAAAGQEP